VDKENPKLSIPKLSTVIAFAKKIKTTLPVYICKVDVNKDQKIFFEIVGIYD
jgi:hypothetical protein|tara:strand:- start:7679 stop:7834 length:156 start_codon:yes stop_codon:yes gene_type:complete